MGIGSKLARGRNEHWEKWEPRKLRVHLHKYLFFPSANSCQIPIYFGSHLPQCPFAPSAHLPPCPFAPNARLPLCPFGLEPICSDVHFPQKPIRPKGPFTPNSLIGLYPPNAHLPWRSFAIMPIISPISPFASVSISPKCLLPKVPIYSGAHFPQMSISSKWPFAPSAQLRLKTSSLQFKRHLKLHLSNAISSNSISNAISLKIGGGGLNI